MRVLMRSNPWDTPFRVHVQGIHRVQKICALCHKHLRVPRSSSSASCPPTWFFRNYGPDGCVRSFRILLLLKNSPFRHSHARETRVPRDWSQFLKLTARATSSAALHVLRSPQRRKCPLLSTVTASIILLDPMRETAAADSISRYSSKRLSYPYCHW